MKTVVCYVTNNIVVHVSQFGSLLDLFWFDTYFPSISNCWARPRGLQKIEYFNWGQRAGKFENHWSKQTHHELHS